MIFAVSPTHDLVQLNPRGPATTKTVPAGTLGVFRDRDRQRAVGGTAARGDLQSLGPDAVRYAQSMTN